MLIDCLQKDAEKKAVTVESLQVRIGRDSKMMQAGPFLWLHTFRGPW